MTTLTDRLDAALADAPALRDQLEALRDLAEGTGETRLALARSILLLADSTTPERYLGGLTLEQRTAVLAALKAVVAEEWQASKAEIADRRAAGARALAGVLLAIERGAGPAGKALGVGTLGEALAALAGALRDGISEDDRRAAVDAATALADVLRGRR